MALGRKLVAAVIIGLALATIVTAAVVARHEQRSADTERKDEAERAASDLTSRFELSLTALDSIQGLFDASQRVSGAEFDSFARDLLPRSPFSSTLLVTRVPASLRGAFERSPGSSPIRVQSAGRLRRAPTRAEYYPVSYRYSRFRGFGRRLPVGLDLASDAVRGPVLRAARDSGEPRATRPVSLPESGRRGLLLFVPIYRRDAPTATVAQRRAALKGLAVSTFAVGQIGDAVRKLRRPGTALQIFDAGRRICGPAGHLDDAVSVPVRAAGRTWTVRVAAPVAASLALPATILLGGLVLTALVALLLLGLGRRERYAHALSDRRLSEREHAEGAQQAAEQRFARAFEDSGVGMALMGADGGRLLDVNDALCDLLAYSRERLLEMDLAQLGHPDDGAPVDATLQEDGTAHSEQRMLNSMGQGVWVLVSTSVVNDEHGAPTHQIVQVQDVSERKGYESRLEYLAQHDPLTGLFNRRRFEEELERVFGEQSGAAVVCLDLDHFKYINDSLGHRVGDELIARVSRLLDQRLRSGDVLARLGGDEFALLLPGADESRAIKVVEDLRRTIRSGAVVTGERGQVGATASFGISIFDSANPGPSADELLAEADMAMYDAKEAGRDRSAVFRPEERGAGMAARMGWVVRIRGALADDGFELHGQRIASLTGDPRTRYELLLRMIGDDGELIPPAAFLPVAERFDLIQQIDRWVITRAIDMLAELQASGVDAVLEVNVSARSVTDSGLADLVRSKLSEGAVDASGLVFEMTETAAIVNLDGAKAFAATLHDLGCEFALDDFGAGFASFHYLKHFAFDYLKIDGEFIEDLPHSATNQLLVRALVNIARGLGKETIAEFVEDEETLALLRELGVDYAQGFHVARPRPISVAELSAAAAGVRSA